MIPFNQQTHHQGSMKSRFIKNPRGKDPGSAGNNISAGKFRSSHEIPAPAKDHGSFDFDDPSKIQVGMEVEHTRFGKGKVLNLEGDSPDKKATVFFQSAGQKQLLLKFARLRIIKSVE
jgi:DNA helicase-2/ATP-dependent DNA helicase PcrA